jgi:NAD(P)-dependent dehydrogenase (short-subunit alcohol dehydrogenase family)
MAVLDHFSLTDRRILVTGATGYLGQSIAWAIAEANGTVIVNSRSQVECETLVTEIRNAGYLAEAAPFDICEPKQIATYFAGFADTPLHGLVNNAYSGGAGSVETAEADDYFYSYQMSVVSTQILTKASLPSLRLAKARSGDAAVVNIASMYGVVSPDLRVYSASQSANPPFYGAAKAALLQWTRYAACEFGHEGIRFNAISPGPFPSENVLENDAEFVGRLIERVPLGRVGSAQEISGAILFLVSTASTFVTGANLPVDGGWTSW